MQVRDFGVTGSGRTARLYRLEGPAGVSAEVCDLGACLVSLVAPDREGTPVDVVLGYDDVSGYESNATHFGAVIGRHANRIGGASFELDGHRYELAANEGANSLHSGPDLWRTRLWDVVRAQDTPQGGLVELALASPDGDQGFPGAVQVHVTYELAGATLTVTYAGTPDARTVMNLTNHSYFNLNGHGSGTVLGHRISVDADFFTEFDGTLVPTGRLVPVEGTPLDLRHEARLGDAVESGYAPVRAAGGVDHNFVLLGGLCASPRRVARLVGDVSGISMDVATELPGVQVYTSNFIDGEPGKGGAVYPRHAAVCLETQFFPDAVHHREFDQPVFGPERPYLSSTSFALGLA